MVIRGRRRGEERRRLFRGSRLPGTSLHHVEDKVKEVTQVNNRGFRDERLSSRDGERFKGSCAGCATARSGFFFSLSLSVCDEDQGRRTRRSRSGLIMGKALISMVKKQGIFVAMHN